MTMRKKYRVLNLIFYCILLIPNVVHGVEIRPENVVEKYFTFDLEGVRLEGGTYKLIASLITWKDEPGWDTAFITRKAYIYKQENLKENEVAIEVRYENIGLVAGDVLLDIDFTEVITFILIKESEQWKIKGPISPPHVSAKAFSKHLEQLLTEIENKKRVEDLKTLINRLKDMSKR
jgi:hypothetical protein